MVDLIAEPALTGLPVTIGRVTLAAFDAGVMTSIAPYPGGDVSSLPFPSPGQVVAHGKGRLVWAGRELAFLLGAPTPDLTGLAAITDQSDGWVWVTLSGRDAVAVLARLTALDMRLAGFAANTSARGQINHLPALIIRTGPEAFEIATYRSMGRTLVHELEAAMRALAARARL